MLEYRKVFYLQQTDMDIFPARTLPGVIGNAKAKSVMPTEWSLKLLVNKALTPLDGQELPIGCLANIFQIHEYNLSDTLLLIVIN